MNDYVDLQWEGGVLCWEMCDGDERKKGDKLKNLVLHVKLEPHNKVQVSHTFLLLTKINLKYK